MSSPLLYIAYGKWAALRGHSRIWANVKVFRMRRRSSHASPIVWGTVKLAHSILSFPVIFRMWPFHRPLSNTTSTDKIRTSSQWHGSRSGSRCSYKRVGLLPFISIVQILFLSGTLARHMLSMFPSSQSALMSSLLERIWSITSLLAGMTVVVEFQESSQASEGEISRLQRFLNILLMYGM